MENQSTNPARPESSNHGEGNRKAKEQTAAERPQLNEGRHVPSSRQP